VIAATVVVETAIIVAAQATIQALLFAPIAAQFTALVAREPSVRAKVAALLTNQTPALA
jgi:hypothetical protein